MKKTFLFIAFVCSVFAVFGQSIEKEIDIRDVPDFVRTAMDPEESYVLKIKNNFKPKDVTYAEIAALSEFMRVNHENKIEGPIEYIYFDGRHSPAVFYEIRRQIDAAAKKYVCVDFTHSYYYYANDKRYPLPENCFANHKNLYWIKMGSFDYEQVPENFCKNCKNLQFAIMWEPGPVAKTAFVGVNKKAKLYDENGESKPLRSIHDIELHTYPDWDYSAFTEKDAAEPIDDDYFAEMPDPLSDDYEDYISGIKEHLRQELETASFSEILGGEPEEVSAQNAASVLQREKIDRTDAFSAARELMCTYLLKGEKSDLEQSYDEDFDTIFDLSDIRLYFSAESVLYENEKRAAVVVGISGNGDAIKDVIVVDLELKDGEWRANEIASFVFVNIVLASAEE